MKPPITIGKSRPYLSPPELKVTPPEGGDPYGPQDPDLPPEDELNEADLKTAKLKFKLKQLQKSLVMIKTDLKECIPRYTVDKNKRNKCVESFKNKAQIIVKQINAITQKIKEYTKMKENITISELESIMDDVLNTLEIDTILDDIGYRRPYAHPPKMRVTTGIDPVEGEYEEEPDIPEEEPAEPDHPDKETNALNNVPNQDAPDELNAMKKDIGERYTMMIQCLGLLKEDNEYQKFFRAMLSKYGVKSPMELSAEKKKKFFNAVDKAWKGKGEVSEARLVKKFNISRYERQLRDYKAILTLCKQEKTPEKVKKCKIKVQGKIAQLEAYLKAAKLRMKK